MSQDDDGTKALKGHDGMLVDRLYELVTICGTGAVFAALATAIRRRASEIGGTCVPYAETIAARIDKIRGES